MNNDEKQKKRRMTKAERWNLQQQVAAAWLMGGWQTQHDLAVRFGVSDAQICQMLKRIKAVRTAENEERYEEELDKRLMQLDLAASKALQSFELSKREKVEISVREEKRRCGRCAGTGSKEGERCWRCEGKGYSVEEVTTRKVETAEPGDPRFLAIVVKSVQEIARIRGFYPEKQTTKIGTQYNVLRTEGGESQNPLVGASPEVLLKARRLMIELKQGGNGEVLDAEFVERKEEDGRDDEKR